MSTPTARQPKSIPVGGQFAPDAQLRSYLRVDDVAAPVALSCEKVDFYGIEEETYTATCSGKEVSFANLDQLLRKIAN